MKTRNSPNHSQKLFKSIFEHFACHRLILRNLGGKTSHWYICNSFTVLNLKIISSEKNLFSIPTQLLDVSLFFVGEHFCWTLLSPVK